MKAPWASSSIMGCCFQQDANPAGGFIWTPTDARIASNEFKVLSILKLGCISRMRYFERERWLTGCLRIYLFAQHLFHQTYLDRMIHEEKAANIFPSLRELLDARALLLALLSEFGRCGLSVLLVTVGALITYLATLEDEAIPLS